MWYSVIHCLLTTGHCALMKADSSKANRAINWARLEWDIRHPDLAETIEQAYKEAAVAAADVDLVSVSSDPP